MRKPPPPPLAVAPPPASNTRPRPARRPARPPRPPHGPHAPRGVDGQRRADQAMILAQRFLGKAAAARHLLKRAVHVAVVVRIEDDPGGIAIAPLDPPPGCEHLSPVPASRRLWRVGMLGTLPGWVRKTKCADPHWKRERIGAGPDSRVGPPKRNVRPFR